MAVENARHLVDDVHRIQTGWRSRIRARKDSRLWGALDVVVR